MKAYFWAGVRTRLASKHLTWFEVWAYEPSFGPDKHELWFTLDQDEAKFIIKNFRGGPDYSEFEIRRYTGEGVYTVIYQE